MYTKLNMIFYKFIMAEANSGPPKWQQYSPAGSGWSLLLPNPEPGGNEPNIIVLIFRQISTKIGLIQNHPISHAVMLP